MGEGDKTLAMVEEAGGEGMFVETDVRREDDVRAMVERADAAFGAIHYGVNNAAITQEAAPLTELSEELFDDVMDTNVKGVWPGMKHVAPRIIAAAGGAIVNVSSAWGLTGAPGVVFYVASKHAILGLTRSASPWDRRSSSTAASPFRNASLYAAVTPSRTHSSLRRHTSHRCEGTFR